MPSIGTSGPSQRRILAVDDQGFILRLIERSLDKGSYRLLTSTSGQQALGLIETADQRIDLLITDLSLPDVQGLILIQHLLRHQPNSQWLVISGWHIDRARAACGEIFEERRFLAKPFTIPALQQRVRDLLS